MDHGSKQTGGEEIAAHESQQGAPTGETAAITIKKYANRRLYNTATSSYVTLDGLSQMVKEGIVFEVFDAKTGENITRSVLTQIIVEEEAKGEKLLPTNFLRQIISMYGDGMEGAVHSYLDSSIALFARNQEAMRDVMTSSMTSALATPLHAGEEAQTASETPLEAITRQNLAMFQNAMSLFVPGMASGDPAPTATPTHQDRPEPVKAQEPVETPQPAVELDALKAQMDAIQNQLNKMAGGK